MSFWSSVGKERIDRSVIDMALSFLRCGKPLGFPCFSLISLRSRLRYGSISIEGLEPNSDASAFDALDYGEEMTFNQTK